MALLLLSFAGVGPSRADEGIAGPPAPPVPTAAEHLVLRAGGGTTFSVDIYRPAGGHSVGTAVFLPDPADSLASWGDLARRFTARGFAVCVPEIVLRRSTAPVAVWGRPEDPTAPWAEAWEEVRAVLAAEDPHSERPVVLGGTGLGASAAAVAASRLPQPPAALVLIAPTRELARVSVGPLLAGLSVPALMLAPNDDREKASAAREIHLAARATCRLWVIDGYSCNPRTLAARSMLAVDLADWMARHSLRRAPAGGGNFPAEGESH